MQISVATATLYFHPFEQSLDIIARAGFRNIELDLFWERKEWAVAQHLRDVPIPEAVRAIRRAGLRVSSVHDAGGVLENRHSVLGYVNPALDACLEALGEPPDCLVFHSPHTEGEPDPDWWRQMCEPIAAALEPYRPACSWVTLENNPRFAGYDVPLVEVQDLSRFVELHRLGVTLDTTHYAEMGVDIVEAARVLGPHVRTVHLSDYAPNWRHAFMGEGALDFPAFFNALDRERVNAITLECSLSAPGRPAAALSPAEMVSRLREGRERVEAYLRRADQPPE